MTERRTIGLAPGVPLEAAGQDERKYGTRNPVVRFLISRWLGRIRSSVGDARVLLDVGTGEGFALERTMPAVGLVVGIDFRADKLVRARARLDRLHAIRADAGLLPFADAAADVVTCTEVLEHLTDPQTAAAELARVTRRRCVVSVPWEPWFRIGNLLRGRNMRRLGDDPEHVQHFSARSLSRALSRSFDDVRVERSFPWLIAVASSNRGG